MLQQSPNLSRRQYRDYIINLYGVHSEQFQLRNAIPILSPFFLYHSYIPHSLIRRIFYFLVQYRSDARYKFHTRVLHLTTCANVLTIGSKHGLQFMRMHSLLEANVCNGSCKRVCYSCIHGSKEHLI